MIHLLQREWANISSLDVFLTTCVGFLVIFLVFSAIYKKLGLEYINFFDSIYSVFEKEYFSRFLKYTYWALFQQCLVLIPIFYANLPVLWSYIASVLAFSFVFHIDNWKLIFATFCFSSVFYALWYFMGYQSFVYLSILHAFGGTAYYSLKLDMRVWRFRWVASLIEFVKIRLFL